MQENIPQPNQERNLALERQEAVVRHNELLKDYNNMPEEDKNFPKEREYRATPEVEENFAERSKLKREVKNIDEYRDIASPKEDIEEYKIVDTTGIEKIKLEKEKIQKEIGAVEKDIIYTTQDLNRIRHELGMSDSNDIPSLADKKQKLKNLVAVQSELESKLKFENQKSEAQEEENLENSKREGKNMNEGLEEVSFNLKKVASLLEERQSLGYTTIFKNEEDFRSVARKIGDSLDKDEVKNNLVRLGHIVEGSAENRQRGVNDNTESLYSMARGLRQLAGSLLELPTKVQNEEERKELSKITGYVAEKLNAKASGVAGKAQALEEYNK